MVYLGLDSRERGRVGFAETYNDTLGFAISVLSQILMLIPTALVPHLDFDPLPSDISLERIVIEDRGNVLHHELIGGVAEEEISLPDAGVPDDHYIHGGLELL